jgi:hypothetical protein
MSLFRSIMDKIFHHNTATASAAPPESPRQAQQPTAASAAGTATSSAGTGASTQRLQSVDVDAVLTKLAASKGGGGNWRTSIVDLLKLLDLDSSLAARKELANELNVHAGADGSAEQNIALSKAVMQKLAENGGKVPESLRA